MSSHTGAVDVCLLTKAFGLMFLCLRSSLTMSVLPSSTAWVRGTWLVMSVDHCRGKVTENNKMMNIVWIPSCWG